MNHGRRLTKSRDRMLAGVCGGIAEYLGWSATRTRVAYVLVSILSAAFPGVLVYILLAFVMPPPDEHGKFRIEDVRLQ